MRKKKTSKELSRRYNKRKSIYHQRLNRKWLLIQETRIFQDKQERYLKKGYTEKCKRFGSNIQDEIRIIIFVI